MKIQAFKDTMVRFIKDEDGATAIEYALMAALIAVIIVTVVGNLGTGVQTTFQEICQGITGAACAV